MSGSGLSQLRQPVIGLQGFVQIDDFVARDLGAVRCRRGGQRRLRRGDADVPGPATPQARDRQRVDSISLRYDPDGEPVAAWGTAAAAVDVLDEALDVV